MSTPVLSWLRGYADCLQQGAEALARGDDPAQDYLGRCQKFDADLRQIDVATLREQTATPAGRALLQALHEARAAFEAAVTARQEQIAGRLRGAGRNRAALRGYADAGRHQRSGPLYFEKPL